MLILNDFWQQKMDFSTLDKTFVMDNLNIVLDKKYFVQADGRGIGISLENSTWKAYFYTTRSGVWKFALKVLFSNEIPRLKVEEGKFTGFVDKIIEQIAFFDFYRFFEVAYLVFHLK